MPASNPDWFALFGQLSATVLGGGIVILTNEFAERRKRVLAFEDRQQREAALFTGIFTIRNFVLERLEHDDDPKVAIANLVSLASALRSFNAIVDKTVVESQGTMAAVFEIGLWLDALVAETGRMLGSPKRDLANLQREIDGLIAAFEQFDMLSGSSLEFLTDDEIEVMRKRPDIASASLSDT